MMRGSVKIRLATALLGCALASTVSAQGSYSPYNESPATALSRYVRTLASDPKDFETLIGAGKAALEMGDTNAAAGFFARADEVDPRSPLPQAGMGAVSVANGDPQAALPYFKRAQELGLPLSAFGCDRGLAYDLLGQQAQAQVDYRAALAGRDSDETRRRLALSLAISGKRDEALQTLAPLSAKGDPGVARVRAFVLALTGDSNSAIRAINAVMPGQSYGVAPFLQRLPSLTPGQRAAAVNLGMVPDAGSGSATYSVAANSGGDRLSGIDSWLGTPQQAVQATRQAPQPVVQASYGRPAPSVQPAVVQPKIWLQLASGQNVDDFTGRFARMKSQNPEVFKGIKPYVARSADRARLLIGPFRGPSDAQILAEDLETVGITSFRFTNSQTDRIAPLAM
jgi:Flp pilus assembly protein TadD